MMKTEPNIGACNDETDCNNNGECINNYCKCKSGFDDETNPKDCSSKLKSKILAKFFKIRANQ